MYFGNNTLRLVVLQMSVRDKLIWIWNDLNPVSSFAAHPPPCDSQRVSDGYVGIGMHQKHLLVQVLSMNLYGNYSRVIKLTHHYYSTKLILPSTFPADSGI